MQDQSRRLLAHKLFRGQGKGRDIQSSQKLIHHHRNATNTIDLWSQTSSQFIFILLSSGTTVSYCLWSAWGRASLQWSWEVNERKNLHPCKRYTSGLALFYPDWWVESILNELGWGQNGSEKQLAMKEKKFKERRRHRLSTGHWTGVKVALQLNTIAGCCSARPLRGGCSTSPAEQQKICGEELHRDILGYGKGKLALLV